MAIAKIFGAVSAMCVLGAAASATTVWSQGFEADTAGWFDSGSAWVGNMTRVASGTNGIASASGGFHAIATNGGTNSAPYSNFDTRRNAWPAGGFRAAIDVYLDMSMSAGEGFDYSVAANNQSGDHRRDFIFHAKRSADGILIGGSNNTDVVAGVRVPKQNFGSNFYLVEQSGWFTFEHVFREAGDGSLAVDLNLLDSGGNVLFTETRNNAADLIATIVGGNRYGWFTHVTVDGGVAVDNHTLELLSVIIPLPTPVGLGVAGLMGVAAVRRRRA